MRVSSMLKMNYIESYGAVANAEHNHAADIDELRVASIYVNDAPLYRRFRASATGRASPRTKRNSHITVQVADE